MKVFQFQVVFKYIITSGASHLGQKDTDQVYILYISLKVAICSLWTVLVKKKQSEIDGMTLGVRFDKNLTAGSKEDSRGQVMFYAILLSRYALVIKQNRLNPLLYGRFYRSISHNPYGKWYQSWERERYGLPAKFLSEGQ